MKISKLFHWLYAVLMFLPLLVFLPTGFYYAFNDNAQAEEYTREEPIYYESNEVIGFNDLIVGHIYKYTYNPDAPLDPLFYSFNYSEFVLDNGSVLGTGVTGGSRKSIQNFNYNNRNYTRVFVPTEGASSYTDYLNCTAYVVYNGGANDNNVYLNLSYTNYELVSGYEEVTYTMGIADSMANAWDRTWEMPLFGWSANTFINAPFSYITSLFGIPNDSTFSSVFGYWVSISICWLVFDVILYVPLLAHRWIDKARIE